MKRITAALPISIALAACGDDTTEMPPDQTAPAQCSSAEYIAFDSANHQSQDIRVQAYHDILALMDEAIADPSLSSSKLTEAQMLYEESASFREKVQGRTDDHFADKPNIGATLDADIMDALALGKTATTALTVDLVKQKIDKTLIRFFFLSIHHEMFEADRAHWDEAFGYFGAPSDNSEGGRKGFASVATKRDATNNTNLTETIFNGIVDGSCELAKATKAAGTESIPLDDHPAVAAALSGVDLKMREVLAYSAGHEAFEMDEVQESIAGSPTTEQSDEMWVKLAELDPYFAAIEPYMLDAGGDSKMRAERIRSVLDAAWADQSGAWMLTIDATSIVEDLEAEFQIDVRG